MDIKLTPRRLGFCLIFLTVIIFWVVFPPVAHLLTTLALVLLIMYLIIEDEYPWE